MKYNINVEFKGHLFDNLVLPKILDLILENNARCSVKQINLSEEKHNNSYARLKIEAQSQEILDRIIKDLQVFGGSPVNIVEKRIELKGHIIESLILPKVLDIIINEGGRCDVEQIDVGIEKQAFSYAKIKILATSDEMMDSIIEKVKKQGAEIF
jgi:hypothetical protein